MSKHIYVKIKLVNAVPTQLTSYTVKARDALIPRPGESLTVRVQEKLHVMRVIHVERYLVIEPVPDVFGRIVEQEVTINCRLDS